MTSSHIDRGRTDDAYAWLIAVTSFFCHLIIGGIFYSFSLFYISFVEYFQCDRQTAGWIGSVHLASFYLSGLVFSVVVSRYGCRIVAVSGALVVSFGLIASSFATSIVALYLTYGIVAGAGCGMVWLSSMIVVQQNFTLRRSLAAGISLTGMPIGCMVGVVLQRLCLDTYGWRGTVLLMGAVVLNCCACGMSYNTPSLEKGNKRTPMEDKSSHEPECEKLKEFEAGSSTRKRKHKCDIVSKTMKELFDIALLSEVRFVLFCLGTFCVNFGIITFTQHNPSRAVYKGVSLAEASLLPLVNGICDAISRIANGFFGNLKGVDRAMQFGILILLGGLLEVMFVFATKFEHFVIYVGLFGILTGGFAGIQYTVQVDLFGLEKIARSQALLSIFSAVACLVTTPFSGFLFDVTQDYDIPFYVTGSVQVLGGVLLLSVAINNRRRGKPPDDVTDDVINM